ncbi:MAG: hypothetical protein JOY78_01580 [Pseudonocardia sp.]|nr:hypothetical protein [Pseudonocardia sp.]
MLRLPALVVPAVIVIGLAPVFVLVAQGRPGSRRRRGGPATRSGRGARTGLPPAGRSGTEGGMWLLP